LKTNVVRVFGGGSLDDLGTLERRTQTIILNIFLAVLVVIGGYFVVRALSDILTSTNPQVGSAIIGAGGAVTVTLIGSIWAKQIENQRLIQQEQRAKKAQVYEEFMEFWFPTLGNFDPSSPEWTTEVEDYVRRQTHGIATWGSEEFLSAFITFKADLNIDRAAAIADFETVLLALRADLGYSNKGLKPGDLIKIFLAEQAVDTIMAKESNAGVLEGGPSGTGASTSGATQAEDSRQ
jgi:hypothetical protein